MDTVLYIGIAQSIFAFLIIFFKSPITISDNILRGWLMLISFFFAFIIFRRSFPEVEDSSWVGNLNILLSFPPFLYLYTKYSIKVQSNFRVYEYLHFIPMVISFVILFIAADWPFKDFALGYNLLNSKLWLRNFFGVYLIVSLWIYLYRSIVLIINYRNQIVNLYSYNSEKNNYNWLQIVIVSFAVIFNATVIIGGLKELGVTNFNIPHINKIGIVLFVYAVSFWGFRQNQLLLTNINEPDEDTDKSDKKSSYKKTGLKMGDVEAYVDKLKSTMEKTEIWKNPELSVADLSRETKIQKHYITQLLNENLNKNFYTFVNEFRTKGAQEMLRSKEFKNWSIVAIAYECGFNSKSAFNNFFKKFTGMTPSEYKNKS
jgi:AraC-like DNA-binding protein